MQALSILRLLALSIAVALVGCATQNTAAGQTPAPTASGAEQSSSTAAPEQALTNGPGSKYVARSGAVKDVTFAVWANGQPVTTISWPNKAVDITNQMRGHANVVVIKWTKTKKTGTGVLTIATQSNAKVLQASVTAKSPASGSVSKTFIALQAPKGRP